MENFLCSALQTAPRGDRWRRKKCRRPCPMKARLPPAERARQPSESKTSGLEPGGLRHGSFIPRIGASRGRLRPHRSCAARPHKASSPSHSGTRDTASSLAETTCNPKTLKKMPLIPLTVEEPGGLADNLHPVIVQQLLRSLILFRATTSLRSWPLDPRARTFLLMEMFGSAKEEKNTTP